MNNDSNRELINELNRDEKIAKFENDLKGKTDFISNEKRGGNDSFKNNEGEEKENLIRSIILINKLKECNKFFN